MGEVAVSVVKWLVRLSIIVSLILAFIVFYNFIYSLIGVTLNDSVIADLLALFQMWLPFNLSIVFSWLLTASVLYLSYRVILFSAGFINKFIGEN